MAAQDLLLTKYEFPEHQTPFGSISFEFIDNKGLFILSFSPDDPDNDSRFQEGSVYIGTNTLLYSQHKDKLLANVALSLTEGYNNGVELQLALIAQLRNDFDFITVDPYLEEPFILPVEA